MSGIFLLFGLQLLILVANSNGHRVKRIVGGQESAAPPPDDPVVFARMYNRDARVEGFRNTRTGLYSFLGIRYADPPTGPYRFARPRYLRLQGDINATSYGPPCPQPHPDHSHLVIGNEDCLLLNVFTPHMPDETTGLPVYVWIHGGGFRYGSAAQYGAEPITQKGVIFVPVQYRLGSLGIIGDGRKDFTGNLAMFDMTAALRWVTEYISFFGGDPKQIKVIGHGSGAASAQYLSMSRLPRSGSINGVVSMSGSALSQYALDEEPVQSVEEIAIINECPSTNQTEIVKCLRKKPMEGIIMRDSDVQTERLQGRAMIKGIAGGVSFGPHVEGADDERGLPGFITDKPQATLKEGKFRKVPLLIGVTKHETGNGITINAVSKIWGTAEKFLSSLVNHLAGLTEFLNVDKATGQILKPLLPGLGPLGISLADFLKIPNSFNPEQILEKLTETTTDLLFNLPAVLSAKLWGQVAPSYLYSFEYAGNRSKGVHFLRGLPIVSEESNENIVGHGDELGYLFDVNDVFGKPIEGAKLQSAEDLEVRNSFTELLAKFAQMNDTKMPPDNIFQLFSAKGSQFIKITNTVEVSTDFRFCQLSLWGAALEAIKTTSCQVLQLGLDSLTNIAGGLTGGLGGILGTGGGETGGILGPGGSKPNRVTTGPLGLGILG